MSVPKLPMGPERLLAHRPPMLFVERLVERFDDKAVAEAVIPSSGICVENGQLFQEYLIELIAQTAAMANGFDLLKEGKTLNEGMLVGVDSFSLNRLTPSGEVVKIITEKTFEFGPVKVIYGEICNESGVIYGSGSIKVWENREQEGE